MSYEKLIIVGNLGKDPDLRYTAEGKAVANFTMAVNKEYTNASGKVKETKWFRVTCWEKTAENANQYLLKGSQVLVEGTLQCDPETGNPKIWDDKNGKPHATFEVNASVIRFLGSPTGADTRQDGDVPGAF